MSPAASPFVLRYGVALLSVTLTLIVRLLLHPFLDKDAPLLLFTLSIMVSAWYGGYGPGVLATLLGAVTGAYLFLEPIYSLNIANTSDRVAVALFVVTGLLISILNQALRSSRRRAEEQEKERARLLVSERQARAAAEAANHAKDEFLATVSHDLRTPLASMLMWIRLLDAGKLDEQTAAHARQNLIGNIKSLSQLIDDLLDVSRIITGKLRIDTRPLELMAVIEAALNVVRPAAEAKKISVETNLETSARRCMGDPARLQQILWNLLSNAVKFTPAEGRVSVTLKYIDSTACIFVTDTGAGIAAENLTHVFERLYQVGGGSQRGLGLGLAIARQLVEMHGGTVRAESAGVGQGATFTMELPLVPLRNAECGMRIEDAAEQSAFRNLQSAILEGVRVLIVDDETDSREVVAMMLKICGARVTEAASSAEALSVLTNKAQEQPPDVLVCDIMMPGEDGYALIQKVRGLDAGSLREVPVIALTANAKAEDRARSLAAGFHAHVTKPVEPTELIAVVASLVGRTGEASSARKESSRGKSDAAAS